MDHVVESRATVPVAGADTPPLRIARVEAIPIALPLEKPVVMAGERIEHARNLLVRVIADNGMVGWGEAASAPLMTGDVLPGMVAAVQTYLAPLVIGQDAMCRAELTKRCAGALLHNTGAKCALDMAINDLVGIYLGVSLADLFGGAAREELEPMYLLGNPRVEDDIAEAKRKLQQGWSFFKLKIGIKDPREEARAAIEIRKHLGDKVALCADANMGMTYAAARLFAEQAREANLMFMEQPLKSDDIEGMIALARVSAIPLNGDESVDSISSIVALHRGGAIRGANIKIIKMGGIAQSVHAMSICGTLGLSINLAGKVAESSLAAAAIVQLGCIAPNLDWGLNITNHYLAQDVTDHPVRIEHGRVRRPRGSGLGVTVNEATVNRLRV